MHKLTSHQYHLVAPFISVFQYHTVLKTTLAGITPGHVYADSLQEPGLVFAQFRHRAFLSKFHESAQSVDLRKFVVDEVYTNCQRADVPLFRLAVDSTMSQDFITEQLSDLEPIVNVFQIYQFKTSDPIKAACLPDEYLLRLVDQSLVVEEFEGKQDLLEEMCSERESVQAFLDHSFGLAAFKDNILAGWCLSEYNYQDRCEIGIATMPPHRRLGLARAMTLSFLKMAAEKGIESVLWHCSKSNTASSRTAISAGFTLIEESPVWVVYLDPAVNQAVHGNIHFEKADFRAALVWYQKALDAKTPQDWIAWNAACAAARLDQRDLAFRYLLLSVEVGFTDLERLTQSQHLLTLRDDPRWGEVITTVNRKLFIRG